MENQQDKNKKEHSYYYWLQNKPKTNDSVPVHSQPKKISSEETSLTESQLNKNQSKWNSMGTWERKTFKVEDFVAFAERCPGK